MLISTNQYKSIGCRSNLLVQKPFDRFTRPTAQVTSTHAHVPDLYVNMWLMATQAYQACLRYCPPSRHLLMKQTQTAHTHTHLATHRRVYLGDIACCIICGSDVLRCPTRTWWWFRRRHSPSYYARVVHFWIFRETVFIVCFSLKLAHMDKYDLMIVQTIWSEFE